MNHDADDDDDDGDDDTVSISREPTHICCRATLFNYWKEHHPKLIVRKPSRDICSICYKFNASYRKKAKKKKPVDRIIFMNPMKIVVMMIYQHHYNYKIV